MVAFEDQQAMRLDVTTRKAGLMTDISFLLRLANLVVSWPALKARERGRWPGLRIESGLPGNDCECLYNLSAIAVCAAAHKAGRERRKERRTFSDE
jgi:hypothetical protein